MSDEARLLEHIKKAATLGEKKAGEALSTMSGRKVVVETNAATLAKSEELQDMAKLAKEDTVIAYTQAVTGLEGVSLLSMSREQALLLVDLFNKRELGTTHVMQEIDRSTIRETLNILANAYVTELGALENMLITLNVPRMVTADSADKVVQEITSHANRDAILFETTLKIEELDIEVSLYFHFYFIAAAE